MAECYICQGTPTLYIGASKREFCKAHYEEAKLSTAEGFKRFQSEAAINHPTSSQENRRGK